MIENKERNWTVMPNTLPSLLGKQIPEPVIIGLIGAHRCADRISEKWFRIMKFYEGHICFSFQREFLLLQIKRVLL